MNTPNEQTNFERNKNFKALSYTLAICSLLLLFFLLTSLSQPVIPKPIIEEGIEVNLGNSEHGLGDEQPEAIGEPAPSQASNTQTSAPPESLDNNGDEVINTPPKIADPKPATKPATVIPKAPFSPTPKTPTPKTLMPSVNTKGGNNGTKNNNSKSQGDDFGNGDKGKINGNPNSNSYNGNAFSGNNGLQKVSGLKGRNVRVYPKFKDDFDENATVYVDVTVDANGNVLTAIVNPKKTTTTNKKTRDVATTRVKETKFSSGKDEDFGTIMVVMKVGG